MDAFAPSPQQTAAAPGGMSIPTELAWVRWIWLIGTTLTVLLTLLVVLATGGDLMFVAILMFSVVQGAITVPAALKLRSGARWARITLMVFGLLSLASIYQSIQAQMWPSLALNVALGSTFSLLLTPASKAFFAAHARR